MEAEKKEVSFSVYAPAASEVGEDIFIQIWMFLENFKQKVDELAKEFDEDASLRSENKLNIPISSGEKLIFVFKPKNLPDQNQTIRANWRGEYQSVQFDLEIPEDFSKKNLICSLYIYRDTSEYESSIPIGECKFKISIGGQSSSAPPPSVSHPVKKYKKAFISYASRNRKEVLKRVQMLSHFDVEFFQDVISLSPGDRWAKELYRNIDDCDVFFLFWSQAAKDSKWVAKEIEYALERKGGDPDKPPMIHPVPIEGPPRVKGPENLGDLHFNDGILYFIAGTRD